MNIGWHDICLKAENLEASKAFYQALGFEVTQDSDTWVHLTNGNIEISLMTFLEENWLNFRGADINAVHAALKEKGIDAPGEPEIYTEETMGMDGTHWSTKDPEGNVVYFDTSKGEEPQSVQVNYMLAGLERYMKAAGIESETFAAFRSELESKYG